MIIGIIGGVGSGKSALATKKILDSKELCFVNYDVKCDNAKRLLKENIVHDIDVKDGKKSKKKTEVNFKFWNDAIKKYKNYNLFLDEFHNIAHARKSQTNWNVNMSIWISQIRKILGSSEKTHIYLISQRLRKIDIDFRDLMHVLIYCQKYETKQMLDTVVLEDGRLFVKKVPATWILCSYFTGEHIEYEYHNYLEGRKPRKMLRTSFLANPYFRYYDSYQLFGESAYL